MSDFIDIDGWDGNGLMGVEAHVEDVKKALEDKGYLVIAPGDVSPLGQLARAAVAVAECDRRAKLYFENKLAQHAFVVAHDPAVQAWAKEKP
jgi:thymidylate kinase